MNPVWLVRMTSIRAGREASQYIPRHRAPSPPFSESRIYHRYTRSRHDRHEELVVSSELVSQDVESVVTYGAPTEMSVGAPLL